MWRERLRDGAGSEAFRTYLDVSLICAFGTLKETPESFSGSVAPGHLYSAVPVRARRLRRDSPGPPVGVANIRAGLRRRGLSIGPLRAGRSRES